MNRTLAVTSIRDGHEHRIAEDAITPGDSGRYLAVCGHPVWATALACPAGPPCPKCVTWAAPGAVGQRPHHRWALTRVLARVADRLLPSRRCPRRAPRSSLPDVRLPFLDGPDHASRPCRHSEYQWISQCCR